MPKFRVSCPPEFRRQMVELVRSGQIFPQAALTTATARPAAAREATGGFEGDALGDERPQAGEELVEPGRVAAGDEDLARGVDGDVEAVLRDVDADESGLSGGGLLHGAPSLRRTGDPR